MEPFVIKARASFPHILQPHQSGPSSPAKFSIDLLVPLGSAEERLIQERAMQCATETFGDMTANIMSMAQNDKRLFSFGPGDKKVSGRTGEVLQGYAGMYFVSASSMVQPAIVKPDGTPVDSSNALEINQVASQIYGGCYVNALIKPWAQNNQHGRTVRWDFIGVQFAGDGEAFGDAAPVDAAKYFGAAPAATAPGGAGMAAPVQQTPVFAQRAPQQGPDGVWRDPATGQPVNPPQMPGYGK